MTRLDLVSDCLLRQHLLEAVRPYAILELNTRKCLTFLVMLAARVPFVRISAAPDNLLVHTESGREVFNYQIS